MLGAGGPGRGATEQPGFTSGTWIATARGEIPVDRLRPGDRVLTRDSNLQELRGITRHDLSGRDLLNRPEARPVMIRAGALGRSQPERDLLLAPAHAVLLVGPLARALSGRRVVLAASRRLEGRPGVHRVEAARACYVGLAFDRHELVAANGMWCETLPPPGPPGDAAATDPGWPADPTPESFPRLD